MKERKQYKTWKYYLLGFAAFLLFLSSVFPADLWAREKTDEEDLPEDFTELSIEDLMDIEVTTFSRKAQKLSQTAAAVFVITQTDIRRSGATNVPELLRMVPGLQVARIDANKWAISSRGFNGRFANKLLVLMDGRSVYTPLFSGVFWDAQDTLLEDIDRIEVIRGPGASVWGANAVNGVINIITKQAQDTQGGFITAGAGTEEKGFGGVRYGGELSEKAYFRIFAKYFNRDESVYVDGSDAADNWDTARGGFRADWKVSESNELTLQGDIYGGEAGQTITAASLAPPYSNTLKDDTKINGGNLLAKWAHIFSKTSNMALKIYYDQSANESVIADLQVKTLDMDFQHQFVLGDRHEIIWGAGYRHIRDDLRNTFNATFEPENDNFNLFSIFIQDDYSFVPNQWRLTIGSKFEHNEHTGYEIQPTARLLWTPDTHNSFWTSVSRAVRSPSRSERGVRLNSIVIPTGAPGNPGTLPLVVANFGNDEFDSEELLSFELGYRVQATDKLSFDIATFYNIYDNLRNLETGAPYAEPLPIPDRTTLPVITNNKMSGENYGIEFAADWRPLDWWRFQASYNYLEMRLKLEDDSTDTVSLGAEEESPHHQVSLRSSTDLPKDLELDLWLRFVDSLPVQDLDSHITLDARLGWSPSENFEIAVIGQNLFDNHHPEFKPEFVDIAPTEVERSVYLKLSWRI